MVERRRFNPPPGWPPAPEGWTPPPGWSPDPSWPDPPPGWQLWIDEAVTEFEAPDDPTEEAPPVVDGRDEQIRLLQEEIEVLRAQVAGEVDIVPLDDKLVLQAVGIYRYHHPLENATAYKEELEAIGEEIASLVRQKKAIEKSELFTFNNSLAQGRRMSNDLARLMLRAYNAESDNAIRSLRKGNPETAVKRVEASRKAIANLGRMMEMRISNEYHALRIREIELTADFRMKQQEEREAAREERARIREERRVEAELRAEREKLDKERAHLERTLALLAEKGEVDEALQARLAEVDKAIEHNDFRAANIRAGYVYVISNPGAFGPGVVKIGLTRRLEPRDRITELSGASVPFGFDVHALFFSEDAIELENWLHKQFADRSVNAVNSRKEFFFVEPGEVREVLLQRVGNLLEFSEEAEATEFYQSVRYWPESLRLRFAPGENTD